LGAERLFSVWDGWSLAKNMTVESNIVNEGTVRAMNTVARALV